MRSSEARNGSPPAHRPRVLVVDDDAAVLRMFGRILADAGYEPTLTPGGAEALQALEAATFDAVVSDLCMPGLSGVEFLEQVRARALDVPVIFVTAAASVETAIKAVEHGALRYLSKPVSQEQLREAVALAVRRQEAAQTARAALDRMGVPAAPDDLVKGFDRVIDSLWLAYQPIVSWSRAEVVAYEALMRSPEPTLSNPLAVLAAAERLGKLPQLGREIRRTAALGAQGLPDGQGVFVNLHPLDLFDDDLFVEDAPLSRIAKHVVLEITERAALDRIHELQQRVTRLRALGYRIAIDDLGAGYAGLTSFAQLEPEVVKVDMSLVRGIDASPVKQKLVRSIIALCTELGIQLVAEGIETPAERDALIALGGDLCQGYLFAKPGRGFPTPTI
jgi:EAL domain-containing protein (putative c-di-GMP-specific phosphodiesterase class I)